MNGQQIDLKGQGISVMQKLGLLETVRTYCVQETGSEIVDGNGKRLMKFGVTPAGEKPQGFTNEFEFMRGDMVNMFVDATKKERAKAEEKGVGNGGLSYEFGKTVTALHPSKEKEGVDVQFSDSQTKHYDLVIAADGQGSRTRRLAFGESTSAASFKSLGIHAAFYNIPRLPTEDNLARIYVGPDNRTTMTRTGNRPQTQIYHFLLNSAPEQATRMKATHKLPLSEQKAVWSEIYQHAGWEIPRFLAGLEKADDFYACEIAQVKMPHQVLHHGSVVLLGDAGYCPSAFTGMGTTLSLIGAYVLAGELAQKGSSVDAALVRYDEVMRQPVEQCQKLAPGVQGKILPTSPLGIWVMNNLLWTASFFKIDWVIGRICGLLPDTSPVWALPEYPELKLDGGVAS